MILQIPVGSMWNELQRTFIGDSKRIQVLPEAVGHARRQDDPAVVWTEGDDSTVEELVIVRRQQQRVPWIHPLPVRRLPPWLDMAGDQPGGLVDAGHCASAMP